MGLTKPSIWDKIKHVQQKSKRDINFRLIAKNTNVTTMRLSYSALETFQSCPFKYKLQEIDKIKAPKSKEAVFGSTVHSTLKFIHTPGILSPTLDQAMEHFQN
ncbi:MAG: PD-(D/E)XK nuclease family protein, partial [Candidatus Shapirobacteria bacterium]|nr:PD-(D/E)XK nuclease family protein [Candidatus Shapirobacteria bacterium]